jgi:hypothetical protein
VRDENLYHILKVLLDHLAFGEGSSTGASNFPSIWCVDKLLKVRVLEVLAKAGLLFLDLAAA